MKKAISVVLLFGALIATSWGGIIYDPVSPVSPPDGIAFDDALPLTGTAAVTGYGTIQSFTINLTFGYNAAVNGQLVLGGGLSPYVDFTASTLGDGGYSWSQTFTGSPVYDSGTPSGGFTGLDPNVTWHLTLSSPDGNSLTGWSLDITAVPEPVNVALGIFAGVFVVGGLCRTERVRSLFRRSQVGVSQWLDAA
jgi:hypothetical protein